MPTEKRHEGTVVTIHLHEALTVAEQHTIESEISLAGLVEAVELVRATQRRRAMWDSVTGHGPEDWWTT